MSEKQGGQSGARKKATYGCLGMVVAFAALLALIPSDDGDKESAAVANIDVSEPAPAKSTVDELTPAQLHIDTFLTYAIMPTALCSGAVDYAAGRVDAVINGRIPPIEGFEAARQAHKDCTEAQTSISEISTSSFPEGELREPAQLARDFCKAAIDKRADGVAKLVAILDSPAPSMAEIADYRSQLTKAGGDEYSCRFALQGVAEGGGLPAERIERVKPKG